MDNKTPIQTAIQKFEDMGKKETDIFRKALHYAAAEHLKLLLPKEKEFAKECYGKGVSDSRKDDFDISHIIRDQYKAEFLNQLYPKP